MGLAARELRVWSTRTLRSVAGSEPTAAKVPSGAIPSPCSAVRSALALRTAIASRFSGWRFIVWVGGNDNYYKTFSLAQMDYYNWVAKDYDDVVLTEIQKDGTEKIIYQVEIENGTVS